MSDDPWNQAEQFIKLISARWTLPALAQLVEHGRRYQDIYDALDGISYKVLTETLRRAERDGLICRHVDPSRVETATLYELTDLGRSLSEPLDGIANWVDRHWPSVNDAHTSWADRTRGRQ
jgi:DNA-binding HxlR family transcriptional regulator